MTSKSEYAFYQFRKISVSEDGTIMKLVCVYQTNANDEFEAFRNHHKAIVIWFDSDNHKFSFVDPLLDEEDIEPAYSWGPKFKLFHGELVGEFGMNINRFLWMENESGTEYYDLFIVTGEESKFFLENYLAGELDNEFEFLGEIGSEQVAEIFR